MSKIKNIIPEAAFERIRDRIAIIICDEMDGQYKMTQDEDLNIKKTFLERSVPFDVSDLPAINVGVDSCTWDNKHQGNTRANVVITVDCVSSGVFTTEERGDTRSSKASQKIAGKVRYILEDPIYQYLDFAKPFIAKTLVSEMKFGMPSPLDGKNVMLSRIFFHVEANDINKLIEPALLKEVHANISINDSGQGFSYVDKNE
jgi:hypothetical protein